MARALAAWALRRPDDRALDPAAGDGVFLLEALRRLRSLGSGDPAVRGVELRASAARAAHARLSAAGEGTARLTVADFLALEPADLPRFDAVIGNPPFVRFQRLDADHRRRAAALAAAAGLRAEPLASSWAAFVVQAERFLAPGGRVALVLPSEIGHARYARSVLELLRKRFARVTFVLFEASLFPALDQGTVLLLADGHGEPFQGFFAARLASAAALAGGLGARASRPLDAEALARGDARLHHAWLPDRAGPLLHELERGRLCTPLGAWASVSIGYVTGANAFFHLSPARARSLGIAARHLQPALFRARALRGLAVTAEDWRRGAALGHAGFLLRPEDVDDPALRAYLTSAPPAEVRQRAKVRRRRPWYRVTRTAPPDLALSAMSTDAWRLAANEAGAAVSNTLHAVRRLDVPGGPTARTLALAAMTSLAELSAELEGHALGGGMLKLEPSEAARVRLPLPAGGMASEASGSGSARLASAFERADAALRAGDREAARAIADRALPAAGHLTPADIDDLRAGAARLRALRRGRLAPPDPAEPP